MKGTRHALVELLTSSERIRLNLELFRSLANRLTDPEEKSTVLSFNDAEYRQTAPGSGKSFLILVWTTAVLH